jgi:hypothetical protein
VKTLVLIAAYVADGLDKGHRNAAFFADRVNAKTRLIWGTGDDGARRGAEDRNKRNMLVEGSAILGPIALLLFMREILNPDADRNSTLI